MAKLIIDQKEYEVPDNSAISDTCEDAGVRFDCNTGVCGSCHIKILEGAENLSDLTTEEIDLGMDRNNRLACQCTIKTGMVRIAL
ncbi:MAG: 2Fe-2S iron-sulfur cluster-binding protein [Candidatus Omnitrophica bacterium]|nr:2Fe-2S iron-sulfur cluster-binding protein [Candidatus Omnitrophota bacterium]